MGTLKGTEDVSKTLGNSRRLSLSSNRKDHLARMAAEARAARAATLGWQVRQKRFCAKLKRELARRKRAAGVLDERVVELRRELLRREFQSKLAVAAPATA